MNNQQEQEEQLSKEIDAANRAKVVLNAVKGYFIEYQAELFETLKRTTHKEADVREEIYRQLKSIDTVESKLIRAIQTGKLATEQLTRWEKIKESIIN